MTNQVQCPECRSYFVDSKKVVYKEKIEESKFDGCLKKFMAIFLTIATGGLYWFIFWILLTTPVDIEVEADEPFDPYHRFNCTNCGYVWTDR